MPRRRKTYKRKRRRRLRGPYTQSSRLRRRPTRRKRKREPVKREKKARRFLPPEYFLKKPRKKTYNGASSAERKRAKLIASVRNRKKASKPGFWGMLKNTAYAAAGGYGGTNIAWKALKGANWLREKHAKYRKIKAIAKGRTPKQYGPRAPRRLRRRTRS